MNATTKTKNNLFSLISFLILVEVSTAIAAAVTMPSVDVVPDSTNYYADYEISTTTGNGAALGTTDFVYVEFDTTTILPDAISASLVTINSLSVSAVTINGQQLELPVPQAIANKDPIIINIDAAAKIRNPNDENTHRLIVWTTQAITPVYSDFYSFNTSTAQISAAAVTPNPSVAGLAAAYLIGFDIGGGGYLDANNSSITIAFDPATTVPNGALSGVLVNGTSATAVAIGGTVVITTPVNIDNYGSVEVIFAPGTGIVNPGSAGSYYLSVRTTRQPTWTESESYSISPAGVLSISAISAKPDTVNQSGAFAFEVITGSGGALVGGVGIFSVIFEPNTYIPSSIATGNVTISSGGFSDNPTSVTVTGNTPSTGYTTVDLVTPFDIGGSATVSIAFSSAAGYTNPSVARSYQLELSTSAETTPVSSNPFSVFATTTTISQPLITPTLSTATTPPTYTSYTGNFNLGRLGRLKAGESTITFTFPTAYTILETPANYDGSTIAIAGGSSIPITTISASNVSKTVQITVPDGLNTENGDNIVLYIADGGISQPIGNPETANNYQIGIKTSIETSNVNSATFSIGGSPITINNVILDDNTVNNSAQYTFDITTTKKVPQGGYITIVFPQGTELPGTISADDMMIKTEAPTSIEVNQSTRTVKAFVDQPNLNAGRFDVIIMATANIKNPAVPSNTFYKVTMSTSTDTRLVTSSSYTINGDITQTTVNTANVNPAVINATNVVFTINFSTSATGKLVGGAAAGSSTINVEFDTGTILPASITPSNVEVNSTPAQAVVVNNNPPTGGGDITITMPNGMTINNSSSASVMFKSGAGLANNSTAATYKIRVKSSSDNVYSDITGTAGDYTLLAVAPLSFTSVTPTPATQNATAGYSIKFKTGSGGALSSGNTIQLTFPDNTALPTALSTSDVTINTVNPANAAVAGQVVTLTLGATPVIGNLTDVTILINQAAGILNPTLTGSYTIDLSTTAEAGPYTSPNYNITQTSSTVTAANVSPVSVTPLDTTSYMVDFNVGARGRLIAGTSTITVTFNSSTNVNSSNSAYTATYINVDGSRTQVLTGNISINSRAVTIVVPTGVSVDNNDQVMLEFAGISVLQNPGTTGDYTLQVKTSVETSNITSNSYTITTASAVTGISVTLDSYEANAETKNTIDFQVQNGLTGGSGTITIKFPDNTLIPSSMTVSQVQVAHAVSSPATGYANAQAVSTNPSTRTVTLTVPQTINPNEYVGVQIMSSTGITNPSDAGDYTAQVKTSSQNVYGTSSTYAITTPSSTIINLSVDITPNTPNVIAQYIYSFTTGAQGRLISGESILYLLVPNDATFTLGVPALSKVTVNGTAANALSIDGGLNPGWTTLLVTVPSSVTIGNSTAVTVVIDETAGLRNATSAASLTYEVYSSVESGDTYDYSLPVELASFTARSEAGRVSLSWITESELENAYWMIERKVLSPSDYQAIQKGEQSVETHPNPFEIISYIDGQGSISQKTQYTFVDSLVEVGSVNAYRLADVSYAGQVTYHEVIYHTIEAPLSYQLFDNYPNPFNPSTTIKFTLPVDARVELKIYNVLGQEIITLADDIQKTGFHELRWDGKTKAGQAVASGMYIVTFRANSAGGSAYTKMMKILLLK